MFMSDYIVRAAHCKYTASDDAVYEALVRATDPLTDTWERMARAKRIGIKINQDKPVDQWVRHEGQLQQLVSEKVVRACLRLLRERTSAEIICSDVRVFTQCIKGQIRKKRARLCCSSKNLTSSM